MGIKLGVLAPIPGGQGYFLANYAEYFSALGIDGSLMPLGGRPFTVSRHE